MLYQLVGEIGGQGAAFCTHAIENADRGVQGVEAYEGTTFQGGGADGGDVVEDAEGRF